MKINQPQLSHGDLSIALAESMFQVCQTWDEYDLLNRGDLASLVNRPFPFPGDRFRERYQAAEMLSKFPFDIGVDRDAVALQGFRKSEGECAVLNAVFPNLDHPVTPSVLRRARGKIKDILGAFSWTSAANYCGFGPGASTSRARASSSAFSKLGPKPHVTLGFVPFAAHLIQRLFPAWWLNLCGETVGDPALHLLENVVIHNGNKLTTVPKNAKTNRVICIEPDLNMFFQKGIGGLIRARLRRYGLDLNHQQAINRRLAYEGSVDDSLATIDLSSASDSISHGLVELLVPEDWAAAIAAVRSPGTFMPDGSYVPLEKVSSMGNGFTFELETLIFLALAESASSGVLGTSLAVYGDDIIVPSVDAPQVIRALDLCGFRCNEKKTFLRGPFRESCGKHYYMGEDVTPLYIRKPVDTIHRLYWFVNSVSRYSERPGYRDATYQPLYEAALRYLPSWARRSLIPDGVGDDGIVVPFDEARPRRAPRGMEGWLYTATGVVNKTRLVDGPIAVLASLYQLERGCTEYTPGVPVIARREVLRRSLRHTQQWVGPGPWI